MLLTLSGQLNCCFTFSFFFTKLTGGSGEHAVIGQAVSQEVLMLWLTTQDEVLWIDLFYQILD